MGSKEKLHSVYTIKFCLEKKNLGRKERDERKVCNKPKKAHLQNVSIFSSPTIMLMMRHVRKEKHKPGSHCHLLMVLYFIIREQ